MKARPELQPTLREASTNVLETMFFADAEPAHGAVHSDAVACSLLCTGAEEGSFKVAIDRAALLLLCEAFFGEDDEPGMIRELELLCELTNMLAGSTLSAYAPDHLCPLSTPQLCDVAAHSATLAMPMHRTATANFAIDGGLISVSCALQAAA